MNYSTILPAPGTLINSAGMEDSLNGLPAPGFSGLDIKSKYPVEVLKSRSNRGTPVSENTHEWSFSISYHPMSFEEYNAIESFIFAHNTRKIPFYVVLPNYDKPNSPFDAFARDNVITVKDVYYAGENTIEIGDDLPEYLLPNCYINLLDNQDALHESTYKVARVETPSAYVGDAVPAGRLRLTLFPPLQRDSVGTVTVRFINPVFRVLQEGADISPSYDSNNRVSFSMQVKEILP